MFIDSSLKVMNRLEHSGGVRFAQKFESHSRCRHSLGNYGPKGGEASHNKKL